MNFIVKRFQVDLGDTLLAPSKQMCYIEVDTSGGATATEPGWVTSDKTYKICLDINGASSPDGYFEIIPSTEILFGGIVDSQTFLRSSVQNVNLDLSCSRGCSANSRVYLTLTDCEHTQVGVRI